MKRLFVILLISLILAAEFLDETEAASRRRRSRRSYRAEDSDEDSDDGVNFQVDGNGWRNGGELYSGGRNMDL